MHSWKRTAFVGDFGDLCVPYSFGATFKFLTYFTNDTFKGIKNILYVYYLYIKVELQKHWFFTLIKSVCSEEGFHRKTRGARVAQLVECTSHVQRLGPRCSSPDFESDLWPFAPCRKWLTWKRQHQSRRSRTDHRKEMPADPLGNGALCASCLSMLMSSAAPPLALSWE